MPKTPLNWPRRGVTNVGAFVEQPGDATCVAGVQNVRPRRPESGGSGRAQLASRMGLAATFGTVMTGPVQAMHTIARASGITDYQVGAGTIVRSGASVDSGPMAGQFVFLDSDWSVRAIFKDTRGTGLSTPLDGWDGNCVCFHPTLPDIAFGLTIGRDTGASNQNVVIFGINRFDLGTNITSHQTWGLDTDTAYAAGTYPTMPASGQVDLFPNKMTCNGTYLFVAVKNYVYVFNANNLAFIKRHSIDWCDEVQAADPVTVNGVDYLLTCNMGAGGSGGAVINDPGPSPTVYFGWFARTGVGKYVVSYADAAKNPVAGGATVLTRQRMPMGLDAGAPLYEDHRTFRISEYSLQSPRGPLPWDMAVEVDTDGSVYAYIARTNQGFSATGAGIPDGSVAYVSCCRVNLTAAFSSTVSNFIDPVAAVNYGFNVTSGGWETDTDSLRKTFTWHATAYLNDIPNAAFSGASHSPHAPGEAPSIFAVAVDSSRGQVYFAGRRPSPTQSLPNVYGLRKTDGARLWDTDLKGMIQQNAIAVDPTTGNVVCAGNRTDGWEGDPGSQKAEVWELDWLTGEVVRYLDFTDAVTLNTVINGTTVLATTYDVAINSRGQVALALGPYRLDQ